MGTSTGGNKVKNGMVFEIDIDNPYSYAGEETTNLVPYSNYSDKAYEQVYTAAGWSGDTGTCKYFASGGYNNLPYKIMSKTPTGGAGGIYVVDHDGIAIQDGKTYTVSGWMKCDQEVALQGYALCINRAVGNLYTIGPTINITTEWKRYTFTSTIVSGGVHRAIHIIYLDAILPLHVYWCGFQVEEKRHVTPYTPTSRPPDTILKDTTGLTTITSISPSYNALARPFFNGTTTKLTCSSPVVDSSFTGLTIECFFKTYQARQQTIMMNGISYLNASFSLTQLNPTQIAFFTYGDGSLFSSTLLSAQPYPLNTWIHLIGTWKANNQVNIYYNGALSNSSRNTTLLQSLNNTSYNLSIGVLPNNTLPFNGEIALVRIYNKEFTADEAYRNFKVIKARYGL
jgi:hypothetical protein